MSDEIFNRPSRRILVCDDDPFFLRLIVRHVEKAGFEALTASSGREALEILRREGPQLLITDWAMPELPGVELCRAIRSCETIGFVYIIVLTALTERSRMVEAFGAGADDFMFKPFDWGELEARIRAGNRLIELQAEIDHRNRQVHLANAKMAIASSRLEAANRKLRVLATTDELTGLINRREAMERLARYYALADRHGTPLSLITLDIDHFKRFNDSYGHQIGDEVLRTTAHNLQQLTRIEEDVCRIGGEEFLVLCPQADLNSAARAAERLRRQIAAQPVVSEVGNLSVTISLGLAEKSPSMRSPDDLLRAADIHLYAAKAAGRNRVCADVEPDLQAPEDTEASAATAAETARADLDKRRTISLPRRRVVHPY